MEVCSIQFSSDSWMSPVHTFLSMGYLSEDREKARRVQTQALQYKIENGILYRRCFLGPLLRCVDTDEAKTLVKEIHEGICGIQAGPRVVVPKIINAGYYWPGMHLTAIEEIRKCQSFQRHAPLMHRPRNDLIPVTSAWPFQKWGIDIVGPFQEAVGRVKFLIVAIDYFTKWVEAEPVASITALQVKKFPWKNIVCRYGIPLVLISDNGTQFADRKIQEWCEDLEIQQIFTSVAHLQGNGQVERANRSIVEGIKARLGEKGYGWVDELPHVLWAHRTMHKTSNGETPYSLTYGSEALIPTEIKIPSHRKVSAKTVDNDQELRLNLELLEGRRQIAAIREAKYKAKLERYYNQRVQPQQFKPGEYVPRSNATSHAKPPGKLSLNWEGPYQIKEVLGKDAYALTRLDGTDIPRTWNAGTTEEMLLMITLYEKYPKLNSNLKKLFRTMCPDT
jgi:transposase InsO family protein